MEHYFTNNMINTVCKFSNDGKDWSIGILQEYDETSTSPYKSDYGYFPFCKPVKEDEVSFYANPLDKARKIAINNLINAIVDFRDDVKTQYDDEYEMIKNNEHYSCGENDAVAQAIADVMRYM